ncbi:MAG: O-antigen ligase family protein [Lachnospiraceae bacterium]|nr:O-antigen ligase family protein [Lachnospiraceae bacterium]
MTKLVKERNKKQVEEKDTITLLIEYAVTFFALALVILLPIYLENGYYKVGDVKYALYESITKIALPVLGFMVVLYLVLNHKKWNVQRILKNLSALDYAVIVYLICTLISSALSDYPDKVWNGYSGWFMGLYSQISFVCIYFFISRYAENAKAILFCLCATAGYVFLLGVLNRFLIDPLGVYEGLEEYYKLQFLSTLGQSSWYSAFVCTILPIGVFFFWSSKKKWLRIASGIFSFLGFSTLVTQNSDSAYIALLCFIGVFFWYSVNDIWHLQRFFQLVILFLASVKVINIGAKLQPENMIEKLDKLSLLLINGNATWILLGVSISIWGILLLCQKKEVYNAVLVKKFRNMLFIIGGVFSLVAVLCVILSAKEMLPKQIATVVSGIPYFTWSDNWGNGRGFTWRFTGSMFKDMNIGKKLFGVGPECFPYYSYEYAATDLNAKWGTNVLTNAHNEWFTALINYGIVGGIAYLNIFIMSIIRFAKKTIKNPIVIGVIACLLSYLGHNLFCYQTVLCTPFIFLIIGIGEWYSKKN